MSHTDPEILALRALGETAGTAHDAEHAASCAHCRAELARLTEVVQLARDTEPGETLQAPPPQLWDRIAAATGTSAGPERRDRPRADPGRTVGRTAAGAPAPAPVARGWPGRAGGWPARWPAWRPG